MKITKYFLSMAAALGMLAGCYKPEMVQISAPEDVVAPVLDAVEGPIEITAANMANGEVAFAWTPADYGVQTQVNYSLEVAVAAAPDTKVTITSGITDTTTVTTHITSVVTYDKLNAILFNDLKLSDGVAEDVMFFVGAKVGEYAKIYSNGVTVSAKITAAEKEYPKLWVVGSYNGWAHDASNQFLFDFAGEDKVYQGMIDFSAINEDHSANEFKITGGAWGTDEHSMDGAHDAESKTIKLVAGGGDNINVYQAKRFYHLTFDRALTLTADFSFDQIGVIGDFNGWGADVVMEFNASKQRFYADVEFPADGGFKFRADAGWDVNWGSKTEGLLDGGDNIPVKAGNYRVYVNMNNAGEMTYSLDAKMFGKDEPAAGTTPPVEEPEPEPTTSGWALIGDFNGWGGDLAMTQAGVIWSVKEVELKKGEGWKLRKDGSWDVNRGAAGDVEPFEVPVGEGFEAVAGGKNLTVPADGKYDVYYDEGNEKIYVLAAGADAPTFDPTWFLVGGFNGWTVADMNYRMVKEGDYLVFKNFVLDADNEVKFNAGGWDVNRGGASFSANAALEVVQDGDNLKVAAGTYDVYMTPAADKAYFMTDGKTPADAGEAVVTYIDASAEAFVVGFSGSAIGWDDPSFDAGDRATFKSKDLTDETKYAGTYTYELASLAVAENDEFKVRINGDWIGTAGATVEGLAVTGTDNFIAGEAGTYKVTVTFAWDGLKASEVKAIFAK